MKPTRIALKNIYLFLLGILILNACERDAFFDVPDGDSKLYAFSEITADEKISVTVHTSIGVNTDDDFIFPQQADAEVVLYREGVRLENPGFRYIPSEKAFVSQGAFRPEAGVEYSLEISLKDDSRIKPILGTSIIPDAEAIENVRLRNFASFTKGDEKRFTVEAILDFADLHNNFYIVRPFITVDGNLEPLHVTDIIGAQDGLRYSPHYNGILMDASKIGEELRFGLESIENLNADYDLNEISFETVSITNDAFMYYGAHSKQIDAQSAAISEPVISFSNFENGLGLFTGYSSMVSSFEIK